MKLVAMQPYFFPYLGYFDLMNQADVWLVYDAAQYIRHGWVNRNRILHAATGWQYILVPLKKHAYTTPINQVEIANEINWQTRIFKQLRHYHMDAPYYDEVINWLADCFDTTENNLARLNVELFRRTCRRLSIDKPIYVFSDMNLPVKQHTSPQDLALQLCVAMGAHEYLNPPGGAGLYDAEQFAAHGIHLTIQKFVNMPYTCGRFQHEPALSIIDVMMWNSPAEIGRYLNTYHESHMLPKENYATVSPA